MKTIFLIILSTLSTLAWGQSDVEFTVQLLTPDMVAAANLDKTPFFEWIKSAKDEVETHLKQEKGDRDVLVVISIHHDKNATLEIGARPELKAESRQALLSKILSHPSPKTKFGDYSLLFIVKVNKGGNKNKDFVPEVVLPEARELEEFDKLSLAEKKTTLQEWAQNEIIPIVSYYELKVDSKFPGVLSVGSMLEKKAYQSAAVETITENNPDYWRATMEMEIGNQLIPFSKICMHLAKGEFDKANRLLFVTSYFSEKSTLQAVLQEGISKRLRLFQDELNKGIQEGIAFHDKGKYSEAIAQYEKLLAIVPNSAWLNYELYYSKAAKSKASDQGAAEWANAKGTIYACDPMYPMDVHANSGKGGYLLFRRQEINELFKTKDKAKADFINYADIALDLENYGFAAQLYWLIFSTTASKDYGNRNILAHYLYCLDKLGDKESIKNFKGDFPAEFDKIKKEREKLMKESPLYSSFEKQE